MRSKARIACYVALGLAFLAIVVGYTRLSRVRYAYHPNGAIIFVFNSSAPAYFATQVRAGIFDAKAVLEEAHQHRPEVVGLDLQIPTNAAEGWYTYVRAYYMLTRAISDRPVLGVISASTSLTEKPVIDVCTTLRVPLLLTVSTNDDLLNRDTGGVVFRIPPNNSRQARDIADWLSDYKRVAIFYELNVYGKKLKDELLRQTFAAKETVLLFPVSDGTEFSTAVNFTRRFAIDAAPRGAPRRLLRRRTDCELTRRLAFVYLGYSERALDLAGKLRANDISCPVVVSDGSLAPEVIQLLASFPFNVRVAIPAVERGRIPRADAFRSFGYDAYRMIAAIPGEMQQDGHTEIEAALNHVCERGPASDLHTSGPIVFQKGQSVNTFFSITSATAAKVQ